MKGQMVDEMSQLDDPINERWDRIIFVFAQVRKKNIFLFLLKRILSVSMFATILRFHPVISYIAHCDIILCSFGQHLVISARSFLWHDALPYICI